jgi:hypothetical protein
LVSVARCDTTSGTDPMGWPPTVTVDVSCSAKQLLPEQGQDLAIRVLAGAETVSELAREHEASSKFVYQQVHTAEQALSQALTPPPTSPDKVLYYLPATKAWLRQLALGIASFLRVSSNLPYVLPGRERERSISSSKSQYFPWLPRSADSVQAIQEDLDS